MMVSAMSLKAKIPPIVFVQCYDGRICTAVGGIAVGGGHIVIVKNSRIQALLQVSERASAVRRRTCN